MKLLRNILPALMFLLPSLPAAASEEYGLITCADLSKIAGQSGAAAYYFDLNGDGRGDVEVELSRQPEGRLRFAARGDSGDSYTLAAGSVVPEMPAVTSLRAPESRELLLAWRATGSGG